MKEITDTQRINLLSRHLKKCGVSITLDRDYAGSVNVTLWESGGTVSQEFSRDVSLRKAIDLILNAK